MTHNILLPGGGGPAAIGAIKSLRMIDFKGKIVTTDANPLSSGFYLADKYYVLPRVDDPNFFDKALDVIEKEEIDVIFPTSGFDILAYSKNKKILEEKGVSVIISDLDVIELCMDKWNFYEKTKDRFNLPYSTLTSDGVEFPCFIKPIRGKGSRNTFLCEDLRDLDYYLSKHSDLIIQEYLPAEEYTIDVVADLEGKALVAVPRLRIETKAGISSKGRIVKDEEIQKACLKMSEFLNIKGPSCMQMKLGKDGKPAFVEVNPRMGGGTVFATLAGVNIPKILIDLIDNKSVGEMEFQEITVLRYFNEVVVSDK